MTDFIFRPNKIIPECPVCGLSFSHGHKAGDKPNMFFIVHPEPPDKNATTTALPPSEPKKYVPSDHLPKKDQTKSQLLRAVLFVRWQHEVSRKTLSAEDFYNREMDRIINTEKSKL